MATTSYTWLQLKNMSGGISCQQVEAVATALASPNPLSDSTVFTDTAWLAALASAGLQRFSFGAMIRKMTLGQQKTLVLWALGQLSSNLPAAWPQTAAIQSKITDIIDCINAPTAGKKAALQTWASSLTIDWTDLKETHMKGMAIAVTNLLVDGTQTYYDVILFIGMLRTGAIEIAGFNATNVDNAILNQIKTIANIT